MKETLEQIRLNTLESLKNAEDEAAIDAINLAVFGKNGSLTEILKGMGKLSKEERAAVGQLVNGVKKELEKELNQRKAEIAAKMQELRFEKEAIDVTEPGKISMPEGHLHPMTQTYREIRDALVGMGFTTYEGPEVEYDDYNFTKLNLPLDHPARDMQDTFYVNDKVVLRTHTSPLEARALLNLKPPFRLIMPGRVFRVDEVDASHSPVFMQMEGFVVDKNITLADLKGTLLTFIHAVFGEDVKMRFRPSYFPFTEPSAELDISCTLCGGKGCRTCKGTGWLEVLGCGMVNPHVLEGCGIDPNKYTGYAFGMGLERITMLRYGITDMRLFYESDVRFLREF